MSARFDAHGGTLGRSDSNTLALPDPRRHISRLQAEVVLQGTRYVLRNAGNANPIAVNQTSVPPGAASPLAHGDELQVGAYVLRVTLEDPLPPPSTDAPSGMSSVPAHTVIMASAAEPKTHPRRSGIDAMDARPGRLRTPASRPYPSQPQASGPQTPGPQTVGFDVQPGAANPFADLLGSAHSAAPVVPSAERAAPAQPAPNPWAVGPGAPPASARAPLPDDFDPFAATTTIGNPRAPADAPTRDDPFAGLIDRSPVASTGKAPLGSADPIAAMLPQATQSIDELFDLSPVASGPRRDILGDFLADAPAPRDKDASSEGRRKQGGPNLDPLAMFDAPAAAAAQPIPYTVIPDHTPELNAAYRPPEVRSALAPMVDKAARHEPPPRRAAAPSPAAAAVAPSPADAQALWRAFEQGAGIGALPDEARTPELMAMVGRMLRASVDGTLRLMAARAATKQELRAQVTVIQSRDNNPLKFTPDGQAAVEQLLRPPVRGFMPGTDAVQDAMDDLLGHTVGTMAGMRAALQGVLARFTPAQLEAVLSEPSMLDKLLPMNRHAKLWELYLAHHARVKGEAEDRFDNLFGAAFVLAYEEQLEALAQARQPGSAAAPAAREPLPPGTPPSAL